MKKALSLALVCILLALMLGGCGNTNDAASPAAQPTQQVINFAPETTAVATGGLAQALASVSEEGEKIVLASTTKEPDPTAEPVQDQPAETEPVQTSVPDAAVQDAPKQEVPAETATPEPEATPTPYVEPVQPFATATPQPNTHIASYAQVSNTGLGFKFSYPSDWENIPGRSTVCYVQPMTNGTIYPARVAVSMKELPHKCNDTRLEEQMVEYVKTIMSQYDEETFEVDEKLDTSATFMGNRRTLATHYLAYDGAQEIEGYVIMTYFERYVFCYHFVCAYEDFEAFNSAMLRMRDSVSTEAADGMYED